MAVSRNQLAKWANGDVEILRAFEALFRDVEDLRAEVDALKAKADE